jgi:hypothetical protein
MPLELPLCTIIAPLLFVAFFKYAEIKKFRHRACGFSSGGRWSDPFWLSSSHIADQRWDGAPRCGHRTAGGFDYLLAEKAGA